ESSKKMHLIDFGGVCKHQSTLSRTYTPTYYLYSQLGNNVINQFSVDIYALALIIASLFPERVTYKECLNPNERYFLKAINYFLNDCIDIYNWKHYIKLSHYNNRYNIKLVSDLFHVLANDYETFSRQKLNEVLSQYQLLPENETLKKLKSYLTL